MDDTDEVEITCKGTCQGNPGTGAWGVVIVFKKSTKDKSKELSKGYKNTNSVRMDMLAYIGALEYLGELSNYNITVYTNLELLERENESKWAEDKWPRSKWQKSNGDRIENIDLWQRIAELRRPYKIKVVHVKEKSGGAEFYSASNLAHRAIGEANNIDEGYESLS